MTDLRNDLEVPISRHLDLYSYWLSKRNGRIAPARRDMDPGELSKLLPFLAIVDRAAGGLRFRLMGTGVVQELGCDLTGKPLSAHIGNSPSAEAAHEHVFANAQPLFEFGHYKTVNGTVHNSSCLLLPLSDDGMHVNMFITTRAVCLNTDVRATENWPQGAHLKLLDAIDIHHAPDLEKRCLDWKGYCLTDRQTTLRDIMRRFRSVALRRITG